MYQCQVECSFFMVLLSRLYPLPPLFPSHSIMLEKMVCRAGPPARLEARAAGPALRRLLRGLCVVGAGCLDGVGAAALRGSALVAVHRVLFVVVLGGETGRPPESDFGRAQIWRPRQRR